MDETALPSSLSLQPFQRDLLQALVDRHTELQGRVTRETLAEDVNCHPITVSTRMQELRALALVRSTNGPRGGYEPTIEARHVLADRRAARAVKTPITTGNGSTMEIRIREIALPRIHDPTQCRAVLSLEESITEFALGDPLRIGPLPSRDLCIEGVVVERHRGEGTVTLEVEAMQAPSPI